MIQSWWVLPETVAFAGAVWWLAGWMADADRARAPSEVLTKDYHDVIHSASQHDRVMPEFHNYMMAGLYEKKIGIRQKHRAHVEPSEQNYYREPMHDAAYGHGRHAVQTETRERARNMLRWAPPGTYSERYHRAAAAATLHSGGNDDIHGA